MSSGDRMEKPKAFKDENVSVVCNAQGVVFFMLGWGISINFHFLSKADKVCYPPTCFTFTSSSLIP